MREIKFRAWVDNRMGAPFDPFDPAFLSQGGTFDDGTIFMQYTGLRDKNGKEIYEGDIVRFLDGECTSTESGMDCDEFENIGEIVWEGYHWDVTNRNGIDTEEAFHDEFEVIGNIYETPELSNHPQP